MVALDTSLKQERANNKKRPGNNTISAANTYAM